MSRASAVVLTTHCIAALICVIDVGSLSLTNVMMRNGRVQPLENPADWARRCRIEAVRAIHPSIKEFLLELAAEFEALAGSPVDLDPDDAEVQNAVGDRLSLRAAHKNAWTR